MSSYYVYVVYKRFVDVLKSWTGEIDKARGVSAVSPPCVFTDNTTTNDTHFQLLLLLLLLLRSARPKIATQVKSSINTDSKILLVLPTMYTQHTHRTTTAAIEYSSNSAHRVLAVAPGQFI